jgi:hypothetical protein
MNFIQAIIPPERATANANGMAFVEYRGVEGDIDAKTLA